MNFGNARSDEENEKQAMKESTTRYKFLRKQLMEIKLPVEWKVEEYPTLPVQKTAFFMPKSDVMSDTTPHFPKKLPKSQTLPSPQVCLALPEVRLE